MITQFVKGIIRTNKTSESQPLNGRLMSPSSPIWDIWFPCDRHRQNNPAQMFLKVVRDCSKDYRSGKR